MKFRPHVVVGDQAKVLVRADSGGDVGEVVVGQAFQNIFQLRIGEDLSVVDVESHQIGANLLGCVGEGRIAEGDEFTDAHQVLENSGGGKGDVVVVGGIDVNHAAAIEVGFAELEI